MDTKHMTDLKQMLSGLSNLEVDLVYNDNRSTMIRILDRKRKYVRLSIHKMFQRASNHVLDAIVDFIHHKKNPSSSALLQHYIQQNLPRFGYSKSLNLDTLTTQGKVYNLKLLYNRLNRLYFGGKLDLNITWYGQAQKKRGCQMTYGLYSAPLKLIKIHRLLDRKVCPEFYINFVIYHEMLHEVHRPKKGLSCTHIHTEEFKEQEKKFKEYDLAVAWEKKSRHLFFR